MTDLSPAQKALAAFNERCGLCFSVDDDWVAQCLADALGKVADEVVPPDPCGNDCCITQCEQIRQDVLAIAAELRGGTTTTEENN
jgi:hypothetical protein